MATPPLKDPKSRFYVVSHSGPKFEFFKSHVGYHWGPKISENHAKFPIFFAPRFARHALKYNISPLRNSFLCLNILKIFAALRAVSSKICRFPFGPKFPNLKIRWGFPFGPKFPDFIRFPLEGGFPFGSPWYPLRSLLHPIIKHTRNTST